MEHIENYRDHKLMAWTDQQGQLPGNFVWKYTIDDENLTEGTGALQMDEEQTLLAAVAEARRRIDAWPKG